MAALTPPADPARPGSAVERALLTAAAVAIGLLCASVSATVLARWLPWLRVPDDVLLASELMVAVIVLPLAAVTARQLHIAVTAFTGRLRGAADRWLRRLASGLGLLFIGLLLAAGVRNLLAALGSREYYDGDLALPVFIGWAAYGLGLAAGALRLLRQLIRPDADDRGSGR